MTGKVHRLEFSSEKLPESTFVNISSQERVEVVFQTHVTGAIMDRLIDELNQAKNTTIDYQDFFS